MLLQPAQKQEEGSVSTVPKTMARHPTGITVDIVGIEASNRGRSCEEHANADMCQTESCFTKVLKVTQYSTHPQKIMHIPWGLISEIYGR